MARPSRYRAEEPEVEDPGRRRFTIDDGLPQAEYKRLYQLIDFERYEKEMQRRVDLGLD